MIKTCVHVAVERSIRHAAAETSSIKGLRGFVKTQKVHNSAFRYKLDTSV